MTTLPRCPGSHTTAPTRHRNGFRCGHCHGWWLAQIVLSLGYLPGHRPTPPRAPDLTPLPPRKIRPRQLELPL
jgi:hypothetical protein